MADKMVPRNDDERFCDDMLGKSLSVSGVCGDGRTEYGPYIHIVRHHGDETSF